MIQPLYHDIITGIYAFLSLSDLINCSLTNHLWNQSLYTVSFSFHPTIKLIRSTKLSSQIAGLSLSRLSKNIFSLECVNFELSDLRILKTVYHKLVVKSLILSNFYRNIYVKDFLTELVPMVNNIQKLRLNHLLVNSDLDSLTNLLSHCHNLTDLSIYGSFLKILSPSTLFEALPNCLLLKKIEFRTSWYYSDYWFNNLCSVLPQCLNLEELYISENSIDDILLLIKIIPQCMNLVLLQFTVMPYFLSGSNEQKSELERSLLQIFTNVGFITEIHDCGSVYIYTCSKEND